MGHLIRQKLLQNSWSLFDCGDGGVPSSTKKRFAVAIMRKLWGPPAKRAIRVCSSRRFVVVGFFARVRYFKVSRETTFKGVHSPAFAFFTDVNE